MKLFIITLYLIVVGVLYSNDNSEDENAWNDFKQRFIEYYKAGENDKIEKMIYSNRTSEDPAIVSRLLSIGAGSFYVDEIFVLPKEDQPPAGFEPFSITDSRFNLNLDWTHIMYFKAGTETASTSFIWPLGKAKNENVYFSGLKAK